jgi:hypothetical protein
MTKNWLDKLINPLRKPQYPQIFGELRRIDPPDGKIIGKCAEGEIACQNGVRYKKQDITLNPHKLRKLGIPKDLTDFDLPSYHNNNFDFDVEMDNIGSWIYGLNDKPLSYNQIADFLQITFEDAV